MCLIASMTGRGHGFVTIRAVRAAARQADAHRAHSAQRVMRAVGAGLILGIPVRTRNEGPNTACRRAHLQRPRCRRSAARSAWPRHPEGLRAWISQRRTQRGERDCGAVPLDAARSARVDAGTPAVCRARCAAACAPDAGERLTRRVAVESAQAERGSRGGRSGGRRLRSTSLSSEWPDRTRSQSGCFLPRR